MATFSELIQSEKPTLVDFSAEWCGPCKMMPTLILFKDGKAVWRQSGVVPDDLLERIINQNA